MNSYWVGVICGCCAAAIFFTCMMFVSLEQTNKLRAEVSQLREEVKELRGEFSEHEEILNYFGWLKSTNE